MKHAVVQLAPQVQNGSVRREVSLLLLRVWNSPFFVEREDWKLTSLFVWHTLPLRSRPARRRIYTPEWKETRWSTG
jgi:hypothetical protein